MTLNGNQTVREIAINNPATVRVFESLGIDYCCVPLSDAAPRRARTVQRRRGRQPCAASLMAATMRGYVPQRQTFLSIALTMASSVGWGFERRSATAASAVLAGVAYGVWWPFHHALGGSFGGALVALVLALAAGLAAYTVSCRLLGVRELEALLSLRRRAPRG